MNAFAVITVRILLIVALILVRADDGVGQSATGIITGRVLAEDGRALVSALVDIENRDVEGVTTDSLGEFKLDMLAPGEIVVRARLLGHVTYRSHFDVNAGDSLHIVISLAPALIHIDGADRPLSSADVRAEAERLLPELLEQPDVQALIRESFAAQSGPVVAWIPWASSIGVRIVPLRLRASA